MTTTEMKDFIIGLSTDELGLFNQNCDLKLHKADTTLTGENARITAIVNAANEVSGNSDSDNNEINSMLPISRKLSQRPC